MKKKMYFFSNKSNDKNNFKKIYTCPNLNESCQKCAIDPLRLIPLSELAQQKEVMDYQNTHEIIKLFNSYIDELKKSLFLPGTQY